MKTLAINTASSQTAIALIEDGKAVSEQGWISENNEAEKLMPAIDKLLGGDFKQIDNVLVVRGPGSFTGLRIGVATANTFAYLLEKPLYAIDTFEYWWRAYGERDDQTALLVYAGRGGVYISYGQVGTLFTLEEASKELANCKKVKFFGDFTSEQKKHFDHLTLAQPQINFASVAISLDLGKMQPVKLVEPLYIKDPGITLSTKKLLD